MKRLATLLAASLLLVTLAHRVFAVGAAQPNETAVITGDAFDGEVLPLPTYADGTPALESECHFFVSINHYYTPTEGQFGTIVCRVVGRTVEAFGIPGQQTLPELRRPGRANYMVIATRAPQATRAIQSTFGRVKLGG